jgi:high-affinity iron transporter
VIEHIYDINPILDEKGTLGNFLKGLFGYNGNPSLVETIAYGIYMIVTIAFWKRNTLPKKSSIDAPEAPEILA